MTYLYDYLVFLAQAATVVAAVLVVLSAMATFSARRRHAPRGALEVIRLNDYLDDLRHGLEQAMLTRGQYRKAARQEAKQARRKAKKEAKQATQSQDVSQAAADSDTGDAKAEEPSKSRVYALTFEGDLDATKVSHLRHEINAVLTKASSGDEVVVRVKSFGGRVHGYGLAASQLQRVRQHGLNLVVAVDQVAASGGYLMAAVANKVIAAPFAVVGSIGVVAEIPNVHRLLKKNDVDVEVITAGRYKRTLTVLGENTDEGRRKFTEELEDLHVLFQEFVNEQRPGVELEKVATGEAWYGRRAIELNLVDEITTSDEYLMRRCAEADVFEVRWVEHKKPLERVLGEIESGVKQLVQWLPGKGGWR
ncbi:MAG: protease SohB [Gammaproteobacteria bacterium]|nr:protease SohB [Gammaproteobacteria bacterium]